MLNCNKDWYEMERSEGRQETTNVKTDADLSVQAIQQIKQATRKEGPLSLASLNVMVIVIVIVIVIVMVIEPTSFSQILSVSEAVGGIVSSFFSMRVIDCRLLSLAFRVFVTGCCLFFSFFSVEE